MFRRRQRERKLDVFFSAKKAQDVCRAVVDEASQFVRITLQLINTAPSTD
jgi:hypothetical protein